VRKNNSEKAENHAGKDTRVYGKCWSIYWCRTPADGIRPAENKKPKEGRSHFDGPALCHSGEVCFDLNKWYSSNSAKERKRKPGED